MADSLLCDINPIKQVEHRRKHPTNNNCTRVWHTKSLHTLRDLICMKLRVAKFLVEAIEKNKREFWQDEMAHMMNLIKKGPSIGDDIGRDEDFECSRCGNELRATYEIFVDEWGYHADDYSGDIEIQ